MNHRKGQKIVNFLEAKGKGNGRGRGGGGLTPLKIRWGESKVVKTRESTVSRGKGLQEKERGGWTGAVPKAIC